MEAAGRVRAMGETFSDFHLANRLEASRGGGNVVRLE